MDNLPAANLPTQPPAPPTPIPQPPSGSKTKWWVWITGGICLGGIILLAFYFFRSALFPSVPDVTQKQNPIPTTTSQRANPLFETQSATVYGTINKIDHSTISVTNSKGQSGNFPLSDKITIYRYNQNPPQATTSADIKTVELGKQATLFLELIDGQYQVASISYFSSTPQSEK